MTNSVVPAGIVSAGSGPYRPGDLMILNGGRLGRYRIVVRETLAELGGSVRWDWTVVSCVRLISPWLGDWVVNEMEMSPGLCSKVVRAAHLFVLGRFVKLAGEWGYQVGSEFDDGMWYIVRYGPRIEQRSCTCLSFVWQVEKAGLQEVRAWGGVFCKHLLAVVLWKMYENRERGIFDGMASDREPSNGDTAAD